MTLKLAALRLAPIQCTSWGHPDTSGLPTMDYYLSSDLMEPPGADSHYTEKLIRLPNLSVYYEPLKIKAADVRRETFSLRKDAVLYFCLQSLFKYLPQYDEVFPRIAEKVGDCQFVFIRNADSIHVDRQFKHRVEQAFGRYGLNYRDYVTFLPRQIE